MVEHKEASMAMSPPPVEQAQKGFFQVIVHSFFIVPFLITVFCVLLFAAINLLTREQRTAYDYLEDIKTGGLTKRWQGAFELSKILANTTIVTKDQRFTQELIAAFEHAQHDDDRVRQYLALAMGKTGNPIFVAPLLAALKNEKEENLSALIYALGMLKDSTMVSLLYPYLEHPQSRIRSIAVVALGNIASPGSKAVLRTALNDKEPNVQWGAAVSLARMGDPAGKDILLKMLDREYLSRFTEVDRQEQNNLILTAIEAAVLLQDTILKEKIEQLAQHDANMNVRSAALRAAQR